MVEPGQDSVSAARDMARILLIAILVGVVSGFLTWAFIALDHFGVEFLWETLPEMFEQVPSWLPAVAVVAVGTMLAAVVVALVGKRPFETGEAEREYDDEGRMDYKNLFAGAAFSLFSLFSGAPIGPEAPLTDINGGAGSFIADRLQLEPEHVKTMTYAGVAGAFSAFFGAAPVGALLAAELISPKAMNISRTTIVAGLGSGAAGYVVYTLLGGHSLAPILVFPPADGPIRLVHLALAALLGIVGSAVGLIYGKGFVTMRLATRVLRTKPWLAALAGGVPVAAAAVVTPYLLFSGQSDVGRVIENAAAIGALALLAIGLGKLALSAWSLSTAYFGGPIFPLIFAGTCFGLAASLVIPGVDQGVAVLAIVTGMIVAAAVAPLSVTIFISLIADPTYAPVIAIAAVAGFVVRQLLAPTLPGVYRATAAQESAAAQA